MEVDRRYVRGERTLVDPVRIGVADVIECSKRARAFVRRVVGQRYVLGGLRAGALKG